MAEIRTKICGLSTEADVAAAAKAGAGYVGFVFFERSPRHVTINRARELATSVPPGVAKVALSVDADPAYLDDIVDKVPLDLLQLHGRESPARVAQVRARYGLPVMKAIGIADASDLAGIETYGEVADQILVDAKPPRDAVLPGGNGLPFDWRLLQGLTWPRPWMLSGGLTIDNFADAVRLTGARQIDLSSGVEKSRGVKDPDLITRFLGHVASLNGQPGRDM